RADLVRRAAPLLLAAVLAGCGSGSKPAPFAPSKGTKSTSKETVRQLGVPSVATKNTTRVAGGDPIADAAGVAQVVYPAQTTNTRPTAVALAEAGDWRGALAASVLAAPPIRAPILLSPAAALAPA